MRASVTKNGVRVGHTIDLGLFKLNISNKGFSVSSGIPGARVSMDSKGTGRVRLGIPGVKGLSFTKSKKLVGSKKK